MIRVEVPPLSIIPGPPTNGGTSVTLSWPDASTGFIVQSTTNLVSGIWSNLVATPVDTNGTNVVTVTGEVPPQMFFRLFQTLMQTDTVSVMVTDANGVYVNNTQLVTVAVSPQPAPGYLSTDPPSWGTENPYNAGGFQADAQGWQRAMSTPGAGGGADIVSWCQTESRPGDFMQPTPPCTPESIVPYVDNVTCLPGPSIYAEADTGPNGSRGVDGANIVMYLGHGDPGCLTFTFPYLLPSLCPGCPAYPLLLENPVPPYNSVPATYNAPDLQDPQNVNCYNLNYSESWGDQGSCNFLDWLCFDACQVLAQDSAWQYWGGAFNGLHIMLGYDTDSYGPFGTPGSFAQHMLGGGAVVPLPIVDAWIIASLDTQPPGVVSAAMGPINLDAGTLDLYDYYWGKGSQGPSIPQPELCSGCFWYIMVPS
jgi:hypothetical protein